MSLMFQPPFRFNFSINVELFMYLYFGAAPKYLDPKYLDPKYLGIVKASPNLT